MEDRINSGLLFVMIDRAADSARSDWDERLRALPGVARISWWKNVQLNRADWLGEAAHPSGFRDARNLRDRRRRR